MLKWFRRGRPRQKPGRSAPPPEGGGGPRRRHEPTELIDTRRGEERGYEPEPPRIRDGGMGSGDVPRRDWPTPEPAAPLPPPPPPRAPQPRASGGSGDSGKTMLIDIGPTGQGDVVAVLVGVGGPLKNRLYPVYEGENNLGRQSEKGGCFDKDDETISREHGKLTFDSGSFHLRPLRETNPITLDGERLGEDGEMLRDGATIQMGRTSFRFKVI